MPPIPIQAAPAPAAIAIGLVALLTFAIAATRTTPPRKRETPADPAAERDSNIRISRAVPRPQLYRRRADEETEHRTCTT